MNELQYVDLQIDTCDHEGLMGAFIVCREDETHFAIPFVFNGERRELSYHPEAADDISAFKTAFFRDAEEAWLDYIRDCVVERERKNAAAKQLCVTPHWRVN